MTPEYISNYKIIENISESNNSIIYRGIEPDTLKTVIIKTLNKEYPSQNEIKKIKNEYSILNNLQMPGITKVRELISSGYNKALVIEDNNSISLCEYIANKESTILDHLKLAISLSEIIGDLHRFNIIHKNINPSNIIINPGTKRITLIDFNIAAMLSKEVQKAVNPKRLEGDLEYMSPEQSGRMNRSIDFHTDFYSLGATLYFIFTGQPPFQSSDLMELMHMHIASPVCPPVEINPQIPRMLSDIIVKLLSKTAEDRYQSASGIQHDLEECLRIMTSKSSNADYQLGTTDISETINIPEKLYGRENEIKVLFEKFHESRQGKTQMIFVSGHAGIGKSYLVNEIQKPLTEKNGYFLSGKFDSFKRDIPYYAFIQAFQDLIRQLLTESESVIESWKQQILSDIGDNGQVMINIIPELEFLIGKQPPAMELTSVEIQNRVNYVFQNFIKTFASPEHPLVIFIDDMQWADAASINLFNGILNNSQLQHLFIIGSYRDNEVDKSHPLQLLFDEFAKKNIKINTIALNPLPTEEISKLIQDTFDSTLHESNELARIVSTKTGGNPFFVKEFIKNLYNKNYILFNIEWIFNIPQIENAALTDNIVNLMIERIKMLPKDIQEALKICSCIDFMPIDILALILNKDISATTEFISDAIYKGFIRFNDNKIKFAHDRIQEAAYSMIEQDSCSHCHHEIGKKLMEGMDEKTIENSIFTIVQQLNLGLKNIKTTEEKIKLAELNLKAGKKANQAAAFDSSYLFFNECIQLLPPGSWKSHYALTISAYTELCNACYLKGKHKSAEEYFNKILKNAKSVIDIARAYEVKIYSYTAQSRMTEAIELGKEALKKLSFSMPGKGNTIAVLKEILISKIRLRKIDIENISKFPVISDEMINAIIGILVSCIQPSYIGEPKFFPIIVLKLLNLSLKHGNSKYSPYAYGTYGVILCSELGNIDTGSKFGKLSIDLINILNSKEVKSKVYFIFAVATNYYKNHLTTSLDYLLESYKAGYETGDNQFASYALNQYCFYSFFTGEALYTLKDKMKKYYHIMKNFHQPASTEVFELWYQFLINLSERPEEDLIKGEIFNESEIIPKWIEGNNLNDLAFYTVAKQILLYDNEKYKDSILIAEMGSQYIESAAGMIFFPEYNYYLALSILNYMPHCNKKEKNRYKKLLKKCIGIITKFASHTPDNFKHKHLLLEAEKARINGKNGAAMPLYKDAIAHAKDKGFLQDEAISSELAAKFYFEIGMEKFASNYFSKAFKCYNLLGAQPKANELQKKYNAFIMK